MQLPPLGESQRERAVSAEPPAKKNNINNIRFNEPPGWYHYTHNFLLLLCVHAKLHSRKLRRGESAMILSRDKNFAQMKLNRKTPMARQQRRTAPSHHHHDSKHKLNSTRAQTLPLLLSPTGKKMEIKVEWVPKRSQVSNMVFYGVRLQNENSYEYS